MEHYLFYAPQAAFGLCAVIFLALHVFRVNITGANVFIFSMAALTAAFAAAFAYFYAADNEAFSGGIMARRAGLLLLCVLSLTALFAMRRKKFGVYFFPALSAIMFILSAAVTGGSVPAQAAAFFSVDIFSVLLKKKEADAGEGVIEEALMNKLLHMIPAAAFLMLFMASPQEIKLQRLGFNGLAFMLVLSAVAGFFTVTSNELIRARQLFAGPNSQAAFIPVLAQFAIITGMIAQNSALLLAPFMTAAALALLILAAFKSITEEKYQLFAMRDTYILFYLGLLGISSADLGAQDVAVYSVLFAVSAANALEAMGGVNSAKQTMTQVKHSFEKIQDNGYIFVSMLAGFLAEAFIFAAIYSNLKSDPLIHALILIGAALYLPAFLNKLFTIFSMAGKIRAGKGVKSLLNMNVLIMALFISMAAAMLYKW